MPKVIAHALTGAAIVAAIHPRIKTRTFVPLFIGALLALSPDLDLILEWIFLDPQIHRSFTHSIAFSLLIGLVFYFLIFPREKRVALAYALAFASHPFLDYLTSTTGGIKLFYPFSMDYYNSGLISTFELPVGRNLQEVLTWITLETLVFLPVLLIVLFVRKMYRVKSSSQT